MNPNGCNIIMQTACPHFQKQFLMTNFQSEFSAKTVTISHLIDFNLVYFSQDFV